MDGVGVVVALVVGAAIGASMLHVAPGCGSVLPLVVARSTRRSRFTDKLVDLATGRFSQHDFERIREVLWERQRLEPNRRDIILAPEDGVTAEELARVANITLGVGYSQTYLGFGTP